MKKKISKKTSESQKDNSLLKNNDQVKLITNPKLMKKLLIKSKVAKLDNESKQNIKIFLKRNHLKNFDTYKIDNYLDRLDLLNILLFQTDFYHVKNQVLDYHHGFKNLNTNLNRKKIFLSIVIKIIYKNRMKKINEFFTKFMMLKTEEKFRNNFLNILKKIVNNNITEKTKNALQTTTSFTKGFQIYNRIYNKNEYDWKNGIFNILGDYESKPKLLFSIAKKNPNYFKFLVFFKQIDILIKKREKLGFDQLKEFFRLKKNNELNKNYEKKEVHKERYKRKMISRNNLNENSNYTNSIELKQKPFRFKTEYNEENSKENSKEIKQTRSFKYFHKNNKPSNARSEPPEFLLEESVRISEKDMLMSENSGNYDNGELKKNTHKNEIQNYEEHNTKFIKGGFIRKNKSYKVNNKYTEEENFDNSNLKKSEKISEIIELSEKNLSNLKRKSKKFSYKELVAKRRQKTILKNETLIMSSQITNFNNKQKSSKIIFYILMNLIKKRVKNSLFEIMKVKRRKKSEKIIYGKVQLLKRPIQYKIDVNEDDLRSMNFPLPNNLRNSNLKRSKSTKFF